MERLISETNCTKGLPVAHIANQCYLPAGMNRKKKDKTIYEDASIAPSIHEVERKFSFTKQQDFDFLYIQYSNGDSSLLEEKFIDYLRTRFEIQKNKIFQSMRVE